MAMSATSTFEADYAAITTGAGLLDRSERGKLAISGADVRDFLHGQVTQDVLSLAPGHGLYAAFLTNKGKMLGDMRVLDTGSELLLDTERSALQALFNMIRHYSVGYDVMLHKRTLECGLLSVIGPLADDLAARAVADDAGVADGRAPALPGVTEHDHVTASVADVAVRLIRTDVGIDVLGAAGDLEAVRAAFLAAGAVEIGEDAAECLRIESGRPRYGVDLDESVIPQEAGLNARAVSFTKGCYVGQETVARLYYKGKPNRELRGLRSETALAVGSELEFADRTVGTITSVAVSPALGPIALALVRREAPVGSVVRTADGATAVVCELPFD